MAVISSLHKLASVTVSAISLLKAKSSPVATRSHKEKSSQDDLAKLRVFWFGLCSRLAFSGRFRSPIDGEFARGLGHFNRPQHSVSPFKLFHVGERIINQLPERLAMACCRFSGHRDKVFHGTRGGLWGDGYSAASSSLRRCTAPISIITSADIPPASQRQSPLIL